jgi:hypothetical protein
MAVRAIIEAEGQSFTGWNPPKTWNGAVREGESGHPFSGDLHQGGITRSQVKMIRFPKHDATCRDPVGFGPKRVGLDHRFRPDLLQHVPVASRLAVFRVHRIGA